MPSVKCKTAVLCEEVRQEKNDKYILLGVYPGPIGVQSFPATLGLSLYLVLEFSENGQHDITVHVDCGENHHKIGIRLDMMDHRVALGLPTPRFPIMLESEAEIVVSVGFVDEEPEEVGRFSVTHLPTAWEMFPSAPEPLSEQSESDAQDS